MEIAYSNNLQDHLEVGPSNIQQYFAGTTVFVTGATGYLGKVLIEKLLRTCYGLKKIYVMIRPKRNKSCQERYEEFFNDPLYDRLKKEQPSSVEKLSIIQGDCELPNLGLSDEDVQTIISEINCIFHVAATVRFKEHLRKAAYINVRATMDVLKLAKRIHNLKSIAHVSTAYSFCPRKDIDEVFYKAGIEHEQLLAIVDNITDEQLEQLTPTILNEWPNTYTFTKAVAEDLINKTGADLPIAIVRPSIVMLSAKEPVRGWVDNYNGATGLFIGIGLGVIRTMCYRKDSVSDQVPVDYVVNNIIAAAWSVGNNRNTISNNEVCKNQNIPIYNCVSGAQNPITWEQCNEYGKKHMKFYPSMEMQWHYFLRRTPSLTMFLLYHYVLHVLPAYILDSALIVTGKKPRMIKLYQKIRETVEMLEYFTTQTWTFNDQNTQALWKSLGKKDKKLFEFNIAQLDWDVFYNTFIYGTRIYLLKDPLSTLPKAQTRATKLKIAHYVVTSILMYVILRILLFFVSVVLDIHF